jgi:hypothetical protein
MKNSFFFQIKCQTIDKNWCADEICENFELLLVTVFAQEYLDENDMGFLNLPGIIINRF